MHFHCAVAWFGQYGAEQTEVEMTFVGYQNLVAKEVQAHPNIEEFCFHILHLVFERHSNLVPQVHLTTNLYIYF